MKYIIYKTINEVNGRYYIGRHKTNDLNDDYLGSGTEFSKDIEKYGVENFKREVLYVFDNEKEMILKEEELVTDKEVNDPMCYNLTKGGNGGWDWKNVNYITPSRLEGSRKGRKIVDDLLKERGKSASQYAIESRMRRWGNPFSPNGRPDAWTGKSHKKETKRKIGVANSRH